MSVLRTLSIRLDRAPHEPLFSWAAAATRVSKMTLTHLSDAWQVPAQAVLAEVLTEQERAQVEYVSLLEPGTLITRQHALAHLWPVQAAYRFCGGCLADHGRWSNLWALPWELVCPTHNRGLSTYCPTCGQRPGRNLSTTTILDTSTCSHGKGRGNEGCGAALAAADSLRLDDARFLDGAKWRREWLSDAGLTATQTQPMEVSVGGQSIPGSWAVLDLRLLTLILRRLTPSATGVIKSLDGAPAHLIGLTAATYVLRAESSNQAQQRLCEVLDEHKITLATLPQRLSDVGRSRPTPWLQSVLLAVSPPKDLRDRLGCRVDTPTPSLPVGRLSDYHELPEVPVFSSGGLGRARLLDASCIPTLLWAGATQDVIGTAAWERLLPYDRLRVRASYSVMLAAVGNDRSWEELARELQTTVPQVLKWAGTDKELRDRLPRLQSLAEAVLEAGSPIDYRRRRALFPHLRHTRPLDIGRALQSCGVRRTDAARHLAATRAWELLTEGDPLGLPNDHPHALVGPGPRTRYYELFREHEGPLDDRLIIEGENELLRQNVDEPVVWRPRLRDGHWDLRDVGPPRQLPGWTAPSRAGRLRTASRAGDLAALNPDPLAAVLRAHGSAKARERLENFQAVALCRGILPAAQTLGLAQSNLSHQMAVLEERLGHRLLNRSTNHRSLTLTGHGRQLYDAATRLIGQHPLSVGRRPVFDASAKDVGKGAPQRREAFAKPSRPCEVSQEQQRHTRAVRAWARTQGLPVRQFGNIPVSVLRQFQAAHAPAAAAPDE